MNGEFLSGGLKLGLTEPASVDGDIQVGAVNLAAIIGTAIGVPSEAASAAGLWPAEPFDRGLFDSLSGQIKVKSARVALTPALAAQDLRGVLVFDHSDMSFDEIDGTLAGGRVTGSVKLTLANSAPSPASVYERRSVGPRPKAQAEIKSVVIFFSNLPATKAAPMQACRPALKGRYA